MNISGSLHSVSICDVSRGSTTFIGGLYCGVFKLYLICWSPPINVGDGFASSTSVVEGRRGLTFFTHYQHCGQGRLIFGGLQRKAMGLGITWPAILAGRKSCWTDAPLERSTWALMGEALLFFSPGRAVSGADAQPMLNRMMCSMLVNSSGGKCHLLNRRRNQARHPATRVAS